MSLGPVVDSYTHASYFSSIFNVWVVADYLLRHVIVLFHAGTTVPERPDQTDRVAAAR
jgi:hypothetical protein